MSKKRVEVARSLAMMKLSLAHEGFADVGSEWHSWRCNPVLVSSQMSPIRTPGGYVGVEATAIQTRDGQV